MNESILISVKKILGIDAEYNHFDPDILMHINSVLTILSQLGVGPETGFFISDSEAVWSDLLGERKDLELVKSYVSLKVRTLFDPPTSGPMIEALERSVTELEWRILANSDYKKGGDDE